MLPHLWHYCKTGARPHAARLSRWRALAKRIVAQSDALQNEPDTDLHRRAQNLRWQARSGTALNTLLPHAYALVRETARRLLNQPHYPVQLIGGIALFEGGLAEMQTGEGKTLTATLVTFLRALPGEGCHVVTVNDYLARRDAELMGPIYQALGLSVGVIQAESSPDERRDAYSQDITYATSREIGFDFLRDRLKIGAKQDAPRDPRAFPQRITGDDGPVQRGHYFVLVDEADSVLIDDAGTPLIIGVEQACSDDESAFLAWCRELATRLRPEIDFHWRTEFRKAELSLEGCRRILLAAPPTGAHRVDAEGLYHRMEQALCAQYGYHRDRDYVITPEDEIAIVDESTGRILEGRKWQDGLHQAVEAKERLPFSAATGEGARITVQSFFRRYRHLAGMTGTARTAAAELRRTYKLKVTSVPTHRPCLRVTWPSRIFVSQSAKYAAIAEEIRELLDAGRAILVGTPSVDASEALGRRLQELHVPFQILNARHHAKEAEIVSLAGQPGRVTIATNMAGRGTDIRLHDDVRNAGGLHVIATELHSSRRIDRQLIGRCARQGDPGTCRFFVSLEDELFRAVEASKRQKWLETAQPDAHGELPRSWLSVFRKVQRKQEGQQYKHRKQLLRWEHSQCELARRLGLDPYLELIEGGQ